MPEVSQHPRKKDKPNQLAKRYTSEEARAYAQRVLSAPLDPESMARDLADLLTERDQLKLDKKKQDRTFSDKFSKQVTDFAPIFGLDNHYLLAGTVGKLYQSFSIEMAKQLVEEYDCQSPSEKTMAELAAGAYVRVLEFSSHLKNCHSIEYLSSEKNGFYAMLGKELDRANRQFLAAIQALKQLNSPPIEVSVTAKTAFVAQNQQVNAVPDRPGTNTQQATTIVDRQ